MKTLLGILAGIMVFVFMGTLLLSVKLGMDPLRTFFGVIYMLTCRQDCL